MPSHSPHQIWLPQLRSTERSVSPSLLAVTIQSSRQCRLNRAAPTSISSQTMKPIEHRPPGVGRSFMSTMSTISTDDSLPPVINLTPSQRMLRGASDISQYMTRAATTSVSQDLSTNSAAYAGWQDGHHHTRRVARIAERIGVSHRRHGWPARL